ncbi:hypothetical protein KPL47_22825 [Clostridium estertheticum]|uniref:hypothetical protein n=1 Tax=Clostridium TaxID=1485 RepID=UPI001C0E2B46|nr:MULTISPECIES: hypothetical protein [Clostridium]MBU3146529.1 hypothetical protein [Clostridium sp. CF012]MBU3179132.1 hypothetical protein [Clostridium estertheticum]
MNPNYVPINKDFFMETLKKKKSSIRKLGRNEKIINTDRTIRRALNAGKMSRNLLNSIAEELDVYPAYLSGKIYLSICSIKDNAPRPSLRINNYPYFMKEKDEYQINYFLKNVLMLYDISLAQYEHFTFERKIEFLHALDTAMVPVIDHFFIQDAYGNAVLPNLQLNSVQIDQYEEEHYINIWLMQRKEELISRPPKWRTSKEIKKMSLSEIQALDMELQTEDSVHDDYDPFAEKYKHHQK